MTACPVTVIPQKCTGVPITLPEKKNVIFFIDFLGALNFFYNIKMFLKNLFQKNYFLKLFFNSICSI
jgi:hypothetical protein